MATPAEIAQNASYVGDAALGNAGGGVITVDTKPLDNLAFYTMSYNKVKYDQAQKDTDQKIKELSDLSNISLNDLRGKDKEQATGEFSKLLTYANEYARKTPKTQNEKLQNELEWQTHLGEFKNNYGSGKTRAVAYYKQLNDINETVSDAKEKERQINQLNEKFDKTDIGTPISAMADFKVDNIDIPKPTVQTLNTIAIQGNEDIDTKIGIWNPLQNTPAADAAILGIKKSYVKGTPEYNALSDLEKQQADQQNANPSTGKLWTDMTEPLNAVLKQYVDANGNFNSTAFEEGNASNLTVMNAYNAIKNMSNYSTTKKQEAESGYFIDHGIQHKLPINVRPTDFNAGIIDFSKGVKPNQLVLAGSFAKYGGDQVEKKVIPTDNAIQLELENKRQAGENARAKLAHPDTTPAADDTFGNLIYGVNQVHIDINKTDGTKIPNVTLANGSVVDKSGNKVDYSGVLKVPANYFDNSIVTEFNKYVGTTKLDVNGQATSTQPVSELKTDDNGKFFIRMKNGEIDGVQAKDGTFVTSDQFQHITRVAGQKGATKYKKPDTQYGKLNSQGQKVDEYGVPIQ